MNLNALEDRLRAALDADRLAWLEAALAEVRADPTRVRTRFPAAGRNVGRAPLPGEDGDDVTAWTADDAARALLLAALGTAAAEEVPELFRYGDAAEQRAIVRSLHLTAPVPDARDLALRATRSNDPRLVAAALSDWGLEHLDDEDVAQAALKCVFAGVSLERIDDLERRATPRLGQMLADFAHERVAAGRAVPADIWPIIDRHAPEERIAALEAELDHDDAARREAAHRALASRDRQEA